MPVQSVSAMPYSVGNPLARQGWRSVNYSVHPKHTIDNERGQMQMEDQPKKVLLHTAHNYLVGTSYHEM